ncbi:acyl-CoA dehydrogenase family protein [Thermodesulfobacteriota bacterium]
MDFSLTKEQRAIQDAAREFAEKEVLPSAAQRDEEEIFDRSIFTKIAQLGFAGPLLPACRGEDALTFMEYVLIQEELARCCASTAVCLFPHMVNQYCLHEWGTAEQKDRYLEKLAEGTLLGAFSMTEAEAGSDVASLVTTAFRDGDDYVLNGIKCFVTNGGEADLYMVLAKTNPELSHKGISTFMIDKDTPGFTFGKKEKKMGIRSNATRELIFNNCRVPATQLIGEEGQGFKMAMICMNSPRLSSAAMSVGLARAALENAVKYSKQRVQFGRPIADFQGLQFMMAEMCAEVESARLLTWHAAHLMDQEDPRANKHAAIAKFFTSDTAMRVTNNGIQIYGGYGYMRDYPLERYMRDAKICQIFDGTNEIQKMLVSRDLLR